MAGGGTPAPSSSGGKKSVDFTVNLVPTIDLLSVLVAFLLITAVWTQLARINTDEVMQKTADRPKQQQQQERRDLKILVGIDGVMLRYTGEEPTKVDAGADLLKRFRQTVEVFKKRASEDQKVLLSAEDGVSYHLLIEVMDVCLDLGLKALAVGDPSSFEG